MNILKDSVELDCRILLLIFVVTAFGLAASVFGYGLLTPQYVDVVNEGSRSVLLNALPGSAAIAAIMASIRSLRAVPKQRLSIAITIAFLLMLAFIYLAINEYLAWRYGT